MKKFIRKLVSAILIPAMVITICPQMQMFEIHAAESGEPYCISASRPVYVSSGNNEEYAVDGDISTRWESGYENQVEWMYVDLGKKADIDYIYLEWENAYAKSYKIQLSDDEENWRDVYAKGNTSEPEETESQEPTAMSISYTLTADKTEAGDRVISANWNFVENALYKVCVNTEDNVATAPDGYKFNSHGPAQGLIALPEGEYTLIVIALDKTTGVELGRGTKTVIIPKEGETVTEEETESTEPVETEPVEDIKKQTIDLTKYLPDAADRQARYVRVYMMEKELPAYGYSLYEFQVYGKNGIVQRPVDYGVNLAEGKEVACSGTRDEWWMYDEEGNMLEAAYNNVRPENAVDGNTKTSFTSYQGDDEWIYVDLGQAYTLGRVCIDWNNDAGKIYEVQVSSDAENWEPVHRVLKGYSEMKDNFTLYKENVRYVRVFGYTKVESGSGFGIDELQIYEYREGDSKENEVLPELPKREIISSQTGKGTYVSGEMYNEKNKLPTFINEKNIKTPIDSNSWWSSALVKPYSNLLCVTPLKAKFSAKGLGVLTATSGWVGERDEDDLGTDQSSETGIDFYVSPDNFNVAKGYDRVENYGDYSVELGLMDDNGMQMKTTFVKGSPYLFNEFCDNTTVFINSSTIAEVFDGNGNAILSSIGDKFTADHIGFKSFDEENTKAKNDGAYYCVNVPEGTTFKTMVSGSKYTIKVTFPSAAENYMSIAAMNNKSDIEEYYRHGYAFVTDTAVDYKFTENDSKVYTNYNITTKVMREGFSDVTMHALFPHQWKHTADADNPATVYTSVRGDMKSIWSNSFSTTQQFAGLLPTFARPQSTMFNNEEMIEYLHAVVASKINTAPVDDAYWEGKNVHPLAISIIMADQLGETEIKQKLLKKLKSIMVDWFNYDGAGDTCYLIYNKDWGTVYYPNSAYGANAAICDHHFTYGYFMFGAAVLATYDRQFYNDYKEMVEILVRDYADPKEPEDDGNMFCKFRAFDQYQGHSWAGGYADSDSGNNQESASEALFSWVGMYLWGEATQNKTYIDAGAYGFTTEMEAVEQYWFDYDETNWLPEYPFEAAGQIYGASMGYGTYFGGQPTYVYGIQWLPISEYLTNYGMNNEKCAKIYQGLEDDTAYAIEIEKRLGNITEDDEYVTPDNGWQHITWPFLSQSDPQRAYEKFKANVTKVQTEDRANTLWFIAAMDQLGHRTNDYVVTGKIQGSVYVKEETGKYTAQVWNPTEETQTVTIIDKNGTSVGTAKVGSKALVSFEITKDNFELSQTGTPKFKAVSLAGGTVTENVTGEAEFTDTQIVEMSCEQSDATIYYTTDGTVPTTDSQVYTGRFLVSSDTTVKAIAVKDGYIDSAYAAAKFVINGDKVESSDNLALGREVTASSENGAETADKAVDGLANTRWQSQSADDEYIQVDLGAVYAVNTVNINWEAAYAEKYQIQVSVDGVEWTTVAEENGLVGKITSSFAATKARYVRMQGIARGTQYGYSIYEFEVYGALQAQAPTIQPASGIYEGSQQITMSTAVKGAEIKYTLDGSIPTEDSATYTEPFDISKSAIVRAVTYRKGMILSDVTESSIIIAGTITLNKTETKVAIGRTVQIAAMTDQSVTWSSDNTESAKVDENGIVEGVTIGEAVITATAANGERASCKVTVTEPIHITSIELSKTELEMRNKSSETLELIINPADTTDDTTVVWKSSDENVVSVNEAGTLTAKGEGEAVVTAIVGKFSATCQVVVGPVATLEEMVANDTFNLALNKKVSVMPSMPECGGDLKEGLVTDGNLNGGHVATTFGTEGTYIEIDLGDTYDASGIDKVLTKYKEENDGDTPVKGYLIQYSINGVDYTTVKEVNGEEAKAEWIENDLMDIQNVHGEGAVRYVRIFYPDAYNWGIQVREIAVLSTEQNAEKVEIEMCEKPADLILSSDNLCEITYTIVPGENQENYLYRVYLDGNKIEEDVSAGTHIATDVTKGVHTVTVISTYNGNVSEGITKEIYVDDGSLYEYIDTDRNIAKGCNVTVDSIYEKEGSRDAATLVDGIVSGTVGAVVETEWGTQDAEIVLDLGKYYSKEMVEEVILAFKGQDTFCDSYTIEFSAYGSDFEKVFETEGRNFEKFFEDKPDITNYSQRLVRYIKINLSGNVYTYGYQMYEVAVIGTEDAAPEEIQTVISSDIAVTGYQISTAMNGELGKTGIRTVYQKEPLVEEQKVKEFGLVYGFADGTITEEDILIGSSSDKVVSYAATDAGKCKVPMGESKTAEYYVRTMDIAGGYTQNYYVRAYAVLEDDTIAYGTVAKYNVYDVAEKLYSGKQMPTGTAHEALYDIIISSVNPDYPKTDYNWNNTLVKRKEYADGTELKIEGYQMTSTLGGVEDTMGLRVVYSIENTLKDKCNQIGLIYGLVYNNQITESDMSLDSTSDFVKSYPATGNGLTDVKFGTSDTAEYYVRTMDVSNMISAGYTVTYLVRAYAVKNDGTVIYSDVQSYSINDIASELYNNDLMGTYNGHQALYNNILTKVNKDYEEVDYNWQNTILKNK